MMETDKYYSTLSDERLVEELRSEAAGMHWRSTYQADRLLSRCLKERAKLLQEAARRIEDNGS
jgi:hypothetical protein